MEDKTYIKVEVKRRKTLIGALWRGVFNFYCWQQTLDIDVPQNKIDKAISKGYQTFVRGVCVD